MSEKIVSPSMPDANERAREFARLSRTLLLATHAGVLSTIEQAEGYPYGSIVEFLPLENGDVVFLLSTLAEHTRNFAQDARVSLVVTEAVPTDAPLSLKRATLLGTIARVEHDVGALQQAYVALHPHAASYAAFSDFAIYRLNVERVRYIGGFAEMGWIDRATFVAANAAPAAPFSQSHSRLS
ncbi:MAG: pyridoxamine 5'-phosphate oxidase family protein [Bradymonadaceae bacterium]|nr:pyridoxamine 5'-phosphate oxidase family protein [Lujinxingiaceae bacterium]